MSAPPVVPWQLDTDMLLHRRDIDAAVVVAAAAVEKELGPCAIGSFSRVEFKGNYVQDLVYLRNKISDSEDFESAVSRVRNGLGGGPSGRRVTRTLVALLQFMGGDALAPIPWTPFQSRMVTILEGQILSAWSEVTKQVALDKTECTRAREPPVVSARGVYDVTVPRCRKGNTSCRIEAFFGDHRQALTRLREHLATIGAPKTPELLRIEAVIVEYERSGRFAWEGTGCRKIGDLLLALEAVAAAGLISSNHKEHGVMSQSLPYKLRLFPIASVRRK